jgi:hypothetical protein
MGSRTRQSAATSARSFVIQQPFARIKSRFHEKMPSKIRLSVQERLEAWRRLVLRLLFWQQSALRQDVMLEMQGRRNTPAAEEGTCLHPKNLLLKGGNQYGTWVQCKGCQKRLSYVSKGGGDNSDKKKEDFSKKQPSTSAFFKMQEMRRRENGEQENNQLETPEILEMLEKAEIPVVVAKRCYACKICEFKMMLGNPIALHLNSWCHVRCLVQTMLQDPEMKKQIEKLSPPVNRTRRANQRDKSEEKEDAHNGGSSSSKSSKPKEPQESKPEEPQARTRVRRRYAMSAGSAMSVSEEQKEEVPLPAQAPQAPAAENLEMIAMMRKIAMDMHVMTERISAVEARREPEVETLSSWEEPAESTETPVKVEEL